jgi:hypothetical protein
VVRNFVPYAPAQTAKPIRRLVYSFTWGATTDLQVNTAGFATSGDYPGLAETTERSEEANQYQTIKSQTTLELQTDSLATAH